MSIKLSIFQAFFYSKWLFFVQSLGGIFTQTLPWLLSLLQACSRCPCAGSRTPTSTVTRGPRKPGNSSTSGLVIILFLVTRMGRAVEKFAQVKQSLTAQLEDELELRLGQIVKITHIIDKDWYRWVSLSGFCCWFVFVNLHSTARDACAELKGAELWCVEASPALSTPALISLWHNAMLEAKCYSLEKIRHLLIFCSRLISMSWW